MPFSNQPIDITSPDFHANPYPYYAQLRQQAPVCTIVLPNKVQAWWVTRYADVSAVLCDDRFVKRASHVPPLPGQPPAPEAWVPSFMRPLSNNMLNLDGADHDRLRALVHHVFAPKLIEQMQAKIELTVHALIDKAIVKKQFDLVRDFALPLPVTVIADMLGVPPAKRNQFSHWSHRMVDTTSKLDLLVALPAMWQLVRYVRQLVTLRRVHPQNDLTTTLLQAHLAEDKLSEDEVLAMILFLLIAGHETTVNLIANSVFALLQHPDQMQLLQHDPSLIKSAVEELARYHSPVALPTERYACEDVTIAGVTIPRGSLTFAVVASANHDERQFEHPERLDLTRQHNPHLTFGQGIHYCLGAPLARMQAQIAISTLLARLPHLKLAVPPHKLRWRKSLIIHGLTTLPVHP